MPFSLNPNNILPMYRDLFYYRGSLTTPPCSESVQFMIYLQPLRLTQSMVSDLFPPPPSQPRPLPLMQLRSLSNPCFSHRKW